MTFQENFNRKDFYFPFFFVVNKELKNIISPTNFFGNTVVEQE